MNHKNLSIKKISKSLFIFASLIGIFAVTYVINNSESLDNRNKAASNSNCSGYEKAWGDWCVYTYTDSTPDNLFNADNVYHASVFQRNKKLYMAVGGWVNASAQQQKDQIFLFETSDKYGISGWRQVNTGNENNNLISHKLETKNSFTPLSNMPSKNSRGEQVNPYEAFHAVQPSYVPFETYPNGVNCCDAIFYSFDPIGSFPENMVTINTSYVPSNDFKVKPAGEFGDKNPVLTASEVNKKSGKQAQSVSDGHVLFDKKTGKFYMVFTEWLTTDNPRIQISIASAPWTNKKFTINTRNLVPSSTNNGNPQIVIGPDQKYYLFYTEFNGNENSFWVASSDSITGPYKNNKKVLIPPSNDGKSTAVTTPFVTCNKYADRWQMFFSYSEKNKNQNKVYTAFLNRNCNQPPIL